MLEIVVAWAVVDGVRERVVSAPGSPAKSQSQNTR
jgi:hypothetical protein